MYLKEELFEISRHSHCKAGRCEAFVCIRKVERADEEVVGVVGAEIKDGDVSLREGSCEGGDDACGCKAQRTLVYLNHSPRVGTHLGRERRKEEMICLSEMGERRRRKKKAYHQINLLVMMKIHIEESLKSWWCL